MKKLLFQKLDKQFCKKPKIAVFNYSEWTLDINTCKKNRVNFIQRFCDFRKVDFEIVSVKTKYRTEHCHCAKNDDAFYKYHDEDCSNGLPRWFRKFRHLDCQDEYYTAELYYNQYTIHLNFKWAIIRLIYLSHLKDGYFSIFEPLFIKYFVMKYVLR